MRTFRPGRPSPALVVAMIALVVALGGTSYAAFSLPKNSVGTKQLKNNAVSGSKIKKGAVTGSKLNLAGVTVPNALHANSATSATSAASATTATHASSADTATTAGGAPPTGAAAGDLTGSYPNPTLASAEAFHEVGATGEPAFLNGWHNATGGGVTYETAGFYKDRGGVVHLKGVVTGGSSVEIFALPAGDRPAAGKDLVFVGVCACSGGVTTGEIQVLGAGAAAGVPDGSVVVTQNVAWSLDAIAFRAQG